MATDRHGAFLLSGLQNRFENFNGAQSLVQTTSRLLILLNTFRKMAPLILIRLHKIASGQNHGRVAHHLGNAGDKGLESEGKIAGRLWPALKDKAVHPITIQIQAAQVSEKLKFHTLNAVL